MSMKLAIGAGSGYLHVRASGEFSLGEAQTTFLEILAAVAKHGVTKVLLDGRELIGDPTFIERFYYGEFVARAVGEYRDRGVSPGTMFAYVLKPPVLDPRRFGETVALNRGMNVKVTDDLNSALRWLEIAPSNQPDAGDGTGLA